MSVILEMYTETMENTTTQLLDTKMEIMEGSTAGQLADVRSLAMSYMSYKIGKHFKC